MGKQVNTGYPVLDQIVDFVWNDKTVQKHLCKYTWTSGSSTEVYPISVDLVGHEYDGMKLKYIELQWSSHKETTVRGLFKRLKETFKDIHYCDFNKNDGSCPPEVTIAVNVAS